MSIKVITQSTVAILEQQFDCGIVFFHATLICHEDHQTPNAFQQKPERSEHIYMYIFVYLTNNYLILVPYWFCEFIQHENLNDFIHSSHIATWNIPMEPLHLDINLVRKRKIIDLRILWKTSQAGNPKGLEHACCIYIYRYIIYIDVYICIPFIVCMNDECNWLTFTLLVYGLKIVEFYV